MNEPAETRRRYSLERHALACVLAPLLMAGLALWWRAPHYAEKGKGIWYVADWLFLPLLLAWAWGPIVLLLHWVFRLHGSWRTIIPMFLGWFPAMVLVFAFLAEPSPTPSSSFITVDPEGMMIGVMLLLISVAGAAAFCLIAGRPLKGSARQSKSAGIC